MNKNWLSQRFKNFAVLECNESSSLYEHLSLKIATDYDLLTLCSHAKKGQPVPNLLFASVHYLLLKGIEHPLKHFYSSIVLNPRNAVESFTYFKDFCNKYYSEIKSLLQSKRVQTNEVRRCSYLYPIFCYIYQKTNTPLSLIEIGTSAGLLLNWDQYAYSYGDNRVYGNKKSPLHINANIKGKKLPFLLNESPPVTYRVGVDLNIIDLHNEEEYIWLKALIWPEHKERLEIFDHAAQIFKQKPVHLIEGDAVQLLNKLEKQVPKNSTLCIFHTHVANQMPEQVKQYLLSKVKEIGKYRNVFHVYNNMFDRNLHIDFYINGTEYRNVIGETDGHGKWFEWQLKV